MRLGFLSLIFAFSSLTADEPPVKKFTPKNPQKIVAPPDQTDVYAIPLDEDAEEQEEELEELEQPNRKTGNSR